MRRYMNAIFSWVPYSMSCSAVEWYISGRFNHSDYQLKPKHRIFAQHVMVNDALPNRILSGTVIVKGNIDRFTENGVIFEGEYKQFVHLSDYFSRIRIEKNT
jgi:dimethylaniline monooxygenase (N-oxide forming)